MLLRADAELSGISGPTYELGLPPIRDDQSQTPLSSSEVAAILAADEGPRLEFKRVSGKMVSKAMETLCAFANADGGTLILGVADPGQASGQNRIHGIEENPEAVDELRRKIETQFDPPGIPVRFTFAPVDAPKGRRVQLLMLDVARSEHVHSIVGDGTWIRLGASNSQMSARQIAELAYKRGDRSAESECMRVDCALLDTPTWRTYAGARGLISGGINDQLLRVGLGEIRGAEVLPRRAAVLLFADEPGGHLAAAGARCELRLMVYTGTRVESAEIPNLRKPPRAFRGPLIHLIASAVSAVEDELAEGVRLSGGGFEARHRIPIRVVKEAIVNAVIHRDYRLNRDIFIRIFDNRIEIESPGGLPGAITAENIRSGGSRARNRLIARALFDFPVRPNIDAGEGVRMMFAEMERAGLYAPVYRESVGAAGDLVTVVLLSDLRPVLWDRVCEWIERHGSIGNADVVALGGVDTNKSSRLLSKWTALGLLQVVEGRGRRNRIYCRCGVSAKEESLFANAACK